MKNTKSERAKMRSVLAAQTRWICAIVFVAVSTLSTYGQSGGGGSITSPTGIVMVSIPAGTFTMGSPITEVPDRADEWDEKQHSVTLTKFYMSKYQVTQEQYQAVMGSNPSYFKSAVAGESGTPGKLPVENVSWYDALVFCNRLSIKEGLNPVYKIKGSTDPATWGKPIGNDSTWNAVVMDKSKNGYRLPTEAEWEYACRAGTTTAYNTGNTVSDNTGWYFDNSRSTHQVGLKPSNAWCLYDMHGNVWEWCWDRYKSDITTDSNNPTGEPNGYYPVRRGGSWKDRDSSLRSAYRKQDSPDGGGNNVGFRLVRPYLTGSN